MAGQLRSSDPASASFDPALAGADRNTLSGIRMEGNGNPAPLLFGGQSLAGSFTVRADGPVTVTDRTAAAGSLTIQAPAITVRNQLHGDSVDLASTGLLNVEAGGAISAGRAETGGQITLTAEGFVNTGSIEAGGGEVLLQAANILNGGRIGADARAGGGTVSIAFTESYIDTAAALTSANGGHGGALTIDGGAAGHLFSSGVQQAMGGAAAGGAVALFGRDVVLDGTTVDASGMAGGGKVNVGGSSVASRATERAQNVTVTAGSVLRADAQSEGSGGQVQVWADRSTAFFGAVSARGGLIRGTSGSIEVSGQGPQARGAVVDAAAVGAVDRAPSFGLIDPHPSEDGSFGPSLTTLSNGNVLVSNPSDNLLGIDSGAVYLFNGRTGALLSDLVGLSVPLKANQGSRNGGPSITPFDLGSGSGVVPLANGNYVVVTLGWNNQFGAVTWGNGTVGVTGTIDDTNSLVGSDPGDQVGSGGVAALNNGNYVVQSPL